MLAALGWRIRNANAQLQIALAVELKSEGIVKQHSAGSHERSKFPSVSAHSASIEDLQHRMRDYEDVTWISTASDFGVCADLHCLITRRWEGCSHMDIRHIWRWRMEGRKSMETIPSSNAEVHVQDLRSRTRSIGVSGHIVYF